MAVCAGKWSFFRSGRVNVVFGAGLDCFFRARLVIVGFSAENRPVVYLRMME